MTIGVFSAVLAAAEGGSWTGLLIGLCLMRVSFLGGGWKKYDSLQLPSQTLSGRLTYTFGSKFLPVFISSIHPYSFDFNEGVGWGIK